MFYKNKVEEYPENGKDNLRNKLLMIPKTLEDPLLMGSCCVVSEFIHDLIRLALIDLTELKNIFDIEEMLFISFLEHCKKLRRIIYVALTPDFVANHAELMENIEEYF